MEKIYIIEDDLNIRNLLRIAISGFQYEPLKMQKTPSAPLNRTGRIWRSLT